MAEGAGRCKQNLSSTTTPYLSKTQMDCAYLSIAFNAQVPLLTVANIIYKYIYIIYVRALMDEMSFIIFAFHEK